MKSITTAAVLSTTLLASAAHADFIGANAEAGTYNSDDATAVYASADIQHPIPLIPNLRVDVWEFETDDESTKVSHLDLTGYYGVGLLWVSVEGGLTIRSLDTTISSSTESETVPMLYLAGSLSVPGTGITLVAESKNVSSYNDITITDQQFKLQYQPLPIVGIEAGYRSIDQETKASNLDYDGYFFGLTIDI